MPEQPSTGNSKPCDATQGPLIQWSSGGTDISWHREPMFSSTSVGKSAPVLEKLLGCGLQHNSKHCKQGASLTALNCAVKFLQPPQCCNPHLQTVLYLNTYSLNSFVIKKFLLFMYTIISYYWSFLSFLVHYIYID